MVNATTSTGQVKIPPYKLVMRAEKKERYTIMIGDRFEHTVT
jgi:hypothetical protein